MTREELKQEAEEKYFNHKMMDFQGFYPRHYYRLGYLESAEPREKRIAELEKENAELQEKLNIRSCQNCKHSNKSYPSDGSCVHYNTWEDYKNPQLTKAKEVIENLIDSLMAIDGEQIRELSVVKEAEQFLKESE